MSVTLLYANKSSCLVAAERVKVMVAINVHQLTMRHEYHYHRLLLYLDKEGIKELWKLVFYSSSFSISQPGLHIGLLGVILDNAVTVWLDGGAAATLERQQEQQQQQQQPFVSSSSHMETILGMCVWHECVICVTVCVCVLLTS